MPSGDIFWKVSPLFLFTLPSVIVIAMGFSYVLYLLTFLAFPILVLTGDKLVDLARLKKYLKWALAIFIVHNVLFLLGFSIKGDHPDYLVFSLEYLILCLTIAIFRKSKNIQVQLLCTVGLFSLAIGFIQGVFGILLFIPVSQEYEVKKVLHFTSNGNGYQTRVYSFGFATLVDTKCTLETYRNYKHFHFEKLINKTVLFEMENKIDITGSGFKVSMDEMKGTIEFEDDRGGNYTKMIE